jgi:hypothetical protein
MVDTKMFIPKTIKVGYQKRSDTYTGQLAYVIYTDDKGKLRKEKSWQGWRSNKIKPDDFDNEPTSGFVLNKGVGGVRQSWGRDARNEYIRVYDPRNFEFEISVANLLFILQETSSIKGKGLEGEFVYAWGGVELVLLPVGSEEYKECVKHTDRQKIKFDKNDIKEGYSYLMKDGTEVMYLGRHSYNNKNYYSDFNPVGKKHIFVPLKKRDSWEDPYIPQPGFTKIAECTSSSALTQYPTEYDKFKKSIYCADIKTVSVSKIKFSENLQNKTVLIKEDDKYYVANITGHWGYGYGYNHRRDYYLNKSAKPFVVKVRDGTIKLPSVSTQKTDENLYSAQKMAAKKFYAITVTNEKGKRIRIGG